MHERTHYNLTTGQKQKQPKEKSLTSSVSLSNESMKGLNSHIPQPLPIFDGRAQNEPNLHAGFRRLTLLKQPQLEDIICQHENQANIENWFCKDCN
jgi:hypothetical protein